MLHIIIIHKVAQYNYIILTFILSQSDYPGPPDYQTVDVSPGAEENKSGFNAVCPRWQNKDNNISKPGSEDTVKPLIKCPINIWCSVTIMAFEVDKFKDAHAHTYHDLLEGAQIKGYHFVILSNKDP